MHFYLGHLHYYLIIITIRWWWWWGSNASVRGKNAWLRDNDGGVNACHEVSMHLGRMTTTTMMMMYFIIIHWSR